MSGSLNASDEIAQLCVCVYVCVCVGDCVGDCVGAGVCLCVGGRGGGAG